MPFQYSSKDVEDLDVSTKYPPLPDGFYDFQITDFKEMETKKGYPMINATLEVLTDPYKGRTIWHNITFPPVDPATGKKPKWAGMAIHFLKSIGEPWEGDFIVTPSSWIGKRFKAKTKTGKDQNDAPKSEIAFISKDPVGTTISNDDSVPF